MQRKNGQINTLMKNHEKAFSDIKNYYNDITLNNLALINSLKVYVMHAYLYIIDNVMGYGAKGEDPAIITIIALPAGATGEDEEGPGEVGEAADGDPG